VGTTNIDAPIASTANDLWLGDASWGGGRTFNGIIDEVHIYSRALSQAEIEETANDGTWQVSFTAVSTPGKYCAYFIAQDNAANIKELRVNFTIYRGLLGNWYINGVQITSTTQKVYAGSTNVTFKFVKTAGIEDKYLTVKVSETGAFSYGVDYISADTWQSTWTISPGTHTLTLSAYDGTTIITMSVIGLQIGEAKFPTLTTGNMLQIAGAVMLIAGIAGVIISRKRITSMFER
jgi:hypothetical protein